jgi:hypothetical protein
LIILILIVVVVVVDQFWRNIANFLGCFVCFFWVSSVGSFFIRLGVVDGMRFMLRSEEFIGSSGSLGESA